MNAYGVIAEFNPFHDGHRFLLQTIRQQFHPDILVVILSTWFSSRGLPCLQSLETRTRLALEAGADLVIALPAVYALQGADYFALYAVEALKSAGVSVLCFGSESADQKALEKAAAKAEHLQKNPATSLARNAAAAGIALRPNDILAIQYIRQAAHFGMEVRPVRRDPSFPSATAIRSGYFKGIPQKEDHLFEASQSWKSYYPLLRCMLLETPPKRLSSFFLVEEGLENRLIRLADSCADWESFIRQAVTKTYSKARIQRTCMMILMQISKKKMKKHSSFFTVQILGLTPAAKRYLSTLPAGTPLYSRFKELPGWLQTVERKSCGLYRIFSPGVSAWKVVYHDPQTKTTESLLCSPS